jgi:hypothetical protein
MSYVWLVQSTGLPFLGFNLCQPLAVTNSVAKMVLWDVELFEHCCSRFC